ncbi:CPT-binding protein isoform X1 [Solanum lycopersicum]|uniref:CPT-binding protein isoform X1 n=2 Tax=Solanum lycopersicum TaxID=4081 RepID=UPI000532B1EA|nr:CPT-binding protein isoform X2 [Solanum lycopersicum]
MGSLLNFIIYRIRNSYCRSMGLGNEVQKILSWTSVCGNLVLHLVWLILHLIINVWYSVLGIARMVENTLISSGLLKSYNAVNISKVRYLAVVIDSEEARETSKVLELLCWLASVGLKSICLYDREGVLKKSQTAIIEGLNKSQKAIVEGSDHGTLVEHVDLEFVSFADSKPAVAKAANLLFAKHYASTKPEKPNFTESDMSEALQAVGYGGPEPDLLFVYGPVRCHMGFPAWRIRYTEIVHMGTLKSMEFGSLLKAIHKFTKVHQNYGQ